MTNPDMHAAATETVAALRSLEWEQLNDRFAQLDAPEDEILDGEYASTLPDYADAAWRAYMEGLGNGYWLGKGFMRRPLGEYRGEGYNLYVDPEDTDTVLRQRRFAWDVAPSLIDARPSLTLFYRVIDNWGGRNDLIDEVRQVRPGLYLGLYHTVQPVEGFAPYEGIDGRSRVEFFILEGPTAPAQTPDAD